MAITGIKRDTLSQGEPALVRIISTSTLAQVGTAGYVTAQLANIEAINNGEWEWLVSDMVLVYASDGWGFYSISSDFADLDAFAFSTTLTNGPAVVGNFASFSSVGGNIRDLGFLPSDASKTRVVMAGSAVVANHMALFQDTTGTIDDTAATAINNGPIQAGLSGTSGYLASFPSAASKGSLRLTAVANTNDDLVTISNALHGQATVYSIPDVGASTGQFLVKTAALVSGNLVMASGTAGKVVDSGLPLAAGLNYVAVPITAAQFNGMYAAPIVLVAAPGANKLLVLDKLDLLMTYVSANYAAGGVAAVQYDVTANGAGVIASTTRAAADFQAAASTGFGFNMGVVAQTFSTCVNKSLALSNITGAFTTGDSTFVAHVWYKIIPTV